MATVQSKDEDSESGQGLSLPQSPIGFGQENLTAAIQEMSEKAGLHDNTMWVSCSCNCHFLCYFESRNFRHVSHLCAQDLFLYCETLMSYVKSVYVK